MATKAEWAQRVERWERSGLSAEKFARREGYKPKQQSSWRWKLRADRPSQPSTSEPEAGAQCGSSARWDPCGGRPELDGAKGRLYRDPSRRRVWERHTRCHGSASSNRTFARTRTAASR
ncbi:IS66 family insertion sequence element accessory protein TnpA [Sorangium sp. So ce302]|uniref:IS66 family insertion sequence element accessory protein TnpA n=1 Tax=Sorangium sp. So ce302 TaxID=3133297 RepID=UPI003F5F1F4E